MARFALRLVELPTRDRRELRELLRDHEASVSKALLDACEAAGELDAIVQETHDHDRLEAIQQRLAAVGVVTALVERDALSGWWRGLLGERRRPDTQAPAEISAVDKEKIFKRLRQDEQQRRDAWWHWWLERDALRLKMFCGMLACVLLTFTAIALSGVLAPPTDADTSGQQERTDQHGNSVPSSGATAPQAGSANSGPEATEQPGPPPPQSASNAAAPSSDSGAEDPSEDREKPKPPIARWIGWALAGAVVGFLAVLMQRQRDNVSTETARKLRLALWALTGGMLVFLVLNVVRTRPSTPAASPSDTAATGSSPAAASGAAPAEEWSSPRTNDLPAWARTLPPPGSFSSMHQQLGALPTDESDEGSGGLADALPEACMAPAGSFAELACLLRRVPSTLPAEGATEGSASDSDAVMAVENDSQGVAAPVVATQNPVAEGSAPAEAADGSGDSAASDSGDGSGDSAASDSGDGSGTPTTAPAEASADEVANEAPAADGSSDVNAAPPADNGTTAGDAPAPDVAGNASPASPSNQPSETTPPSAADAGMADADAASEPVDAADPAPEPASKVGSILSFVVGWLLGAIGAWLGTRKRNT
jgi:hypothetical protein